MTDHPEPPAPEGFVRHFRSSPLTDPWEPLYARRTPDAVITGMWTRQAHTNSRGIVHGGLITTLADNAMGQSCAVHLPEGARPLTVSLTIDFLGQVQVGQWLTVETGFVKTGGTLCFAQAFVKADGIVCARANATFRVGTPRPAASA